METTRASRTSGSAGGEESRQIPLFRGEVVEAYARRLYGEVILAQPLLVRAWTPVLAALVVAGVGFAALADYARTASAPGYLSPDTGVSALYAPRSGTVETVHVAVGDEVEAGE